MDIQISEQSQPGIFVYGDAEFEATFKIVSLRYNYYGHTFKLTIECDVVEENEDGADEQTCDDCSAQQLNLFPGDTGLSSERTPGSSIEFFNR